MAACVAPSWPEWAVTEEADLAWIRLDLADNPDEIAKVIKLIGIDLPEVELVPVAPMAMVLDLLDTGWADGWLLRRVSDPAIADEAVVYMQFEVAERAYECVDCEDGRLADSDDDGMGYGRCRVCGRTGPDFRTGRKRRSPSTTHEPQTGAPAQAERSGDAR